jgi:hypothetical protein
MYCLLLLEPRCCRFEFLSDHDAGSVSAYFLFELSVRWTVSRSRRLKIIKRFIVSEDTRNSESEHVIDVEDYNKMCLRKCVCEITLNFTRFRSSGDVLC